MSFSKSDVNFTLARLARDHGVTFCSETIERLTNDFVTALENEPVDQNYEVTLEFNFEAINPVEAVRQMITLMEGKDLTEWAYKAVGENGQVNYVDGWDLKK